MEMNLQTRYITKDEFREYTGIDLVELLPNQDAEAFLNRVAVRLEAYLDANYFKNIELMYPEFSDYQKKNYKYALIEQALYVFKNGDISVDSGYNPESGIIANRGDLDNLTLSPNAKMFLMNCGLLSREIRNKFPNNWSRFF